jgi:multidrug efflux pump subunit AcrA (membrane-fusion protein)
MKKRSFYFLLFCIACASCHSKESEETSTEEQAVIITPVTVTSISTEPMAEYIELNATSVFLQRGFVKANANGYIEEVNATVGKLVGANQYLFVLKTKEARSIGNAVNSLDSSFKFHGTNNIKAGITGYVSEVDHQPGDYVQDGEQLAVISDVNSFVFILNLPYELRPYVMDKNTVELSLPDGKTIFGHIASAMPVVDSASQTQNIVIRVNEKNIPVNLIAKVRVAKTVKPHTISLPKQSVLSDETQKEFWVMKVIDDSTAVKVPVQKGIEANDRVEIIKPEFSNTDRILLTGNYGLADTAKIKIVKE